MSLNCKDPPACYVTSYHTPELVCNFFTHYHDDTNFFIIKYNSPYSGILLYHICSSSLRGTLVKPFLPPEVKTALTAYEL